MDYKRIYEVVDASISEESFWKSIEILLDKPHVINKRLWGSKCLLRCICIPLSLFWEFPTTCRKFEDNTSIIEYKNKLFHELQLTDGADTKDSKNIMEVFLMELLPKTYSERHAFQLVFLGKEKLLATFYNVTGDDQNLCPSFTYTFQLKKNSIVLNAACEIIQIAKSFKWLEDIVLPQVIKWGLESNIPEKRQICNESLALVSSDQYYKKYNELKLKYGKEMVQIWPECTDPSKFVYEDVAIATYLLLLWEDERELKNVKAPQTFVDLGCGNGLLVYILTKEGHQGVGIDIRRRQIWDMYFSDVKLLEKTITPSDAHIFPKTDWLIGNHSDELTPWLPVIAARSSYNCNFFLLPCCAYNFDGSKYRRQDSSKSQYTEYLEYIKQLCKDCGFNTDTDRLKIPSTKRICLVGRGRIYHYNEYDKYCNKIQNIINMGIKDDRNNHTTWIQDFKARGPVEKVRNCTQIDKTLIENVVEKISNYLLEGCIIKSDWSPGKTVDIGEVVKLISQDKLKALKAECGGVQTLLKNNHHIFKVQNGKVQLRHPKSVDEVQSISRKNKNNKIRVQEKPCWFYNNHPQGCPLIDSKCSFLHVKC